MSDFPLAPLGTLISSPIADGPHTTPEFLAEGIPFLSVDGIQHGELVFDNCRFISLEDHEEFSKKAKPQRGDVLMGKAASTGKIALVRTDIEFNIWSPLAIIRPNSAIISDFLAFALKSIPAQIQIDNLCSYNTQKNIAMADIPRIRIPLPSRETQQRIVDYLDRETSEIDAAVADLDRYVELLEKRRSILIAETVTGRNSARSDSFSIREGDELNLGWIKHVPSSWRISASQFVLNHQKRDVKDDDEIITAFRDGQVTLRSNRRTDGFTMADKEIGYQHICEGDLVVHSMDGGFGAIGVSDSCGKASPVVHAYTSDSCDLRFISYQLRAAVNAGWISALAKGIRVRSTQFDRSALASLKIAYPPLEEQQQIADYLDRETAEIDALVEESTKLRDLLLKRRSVLITDVVTGRKQV